MIYTDEELVREIEYKYPECPLVQDVCERLFLYSDEIVRLVAELDEAQDYDVGA